MSQQDFLRRLPETGSSLRRRDRLQQRLQLYPLLGVACYGLVVLYSAPVAASSVRAYTFSWP